jgi:hypothetical protein
MRKAVTLDPDVERLIRNTMKARGVSFEEALNEAVRAALSDGKSQHTRRFVQRTFSMGDSRNFCSDRALANAEAMEDEERSRKLSLLR